MMPRRIRGGGGIAAELGVSVQLVRELAASDPELQAILDRQKVLVSVDQQQLHAWDAARKRKATPGPWHIGPIYGHGSSVVSNYGVSVAWCGTAASYSKEHGSYTISALEAEANARTIAQAPQLVAECAALREELAKLRAEKEALAEKLRQNECQTCHAAYYGNGDTPCNTCGNSSEALASYEKVSTDADHP